jgi:hypothetical protein
LDVYVIGVAEGLPLGDFCARCGFIEGNGEGAELGTGGRLGVLGLQGIGHDARSDGGVYCVGRP